jgi:multidrug efflux system membrane fusion protein
MFTPKRIVIIFILISLASAAGYWLWHQQKPKDSAAVTTTEAKTKTRNTPVVATKVQREDLPIWVSALGSVTPRQQVIIRSRVDGELQRITFEEGQMVQQGQLLAEIDPRQLQAQLAQQKAQLQRDQAVLLNAQLDLKRFKQLASEDAIAGQQVDTQTALVAQHQATIAADQALIDNTQLQLSYCKITAPISGRIGFRNIDAGNQIKASDSNGLATITQLNPITVVFSLAEQHLSSLQQARQQQKILSLEAWDRDFKQQIATGKLLTIDNQIDANTGSIRLKGLFQNNENTLFPNQFVNIRLRMGEYNNALTVAKEAILMGANGSYVYRINDDNVAQAVNISLVYSTATQAVISGDLSEGQRVVIEGADKLKDGASVSVIHTPGKKPTTADK